MPFFVKGEKIVLKKDGTWVADGIEITHDQTRDLFFRSIHWDADQNQYYLEVGYERLFFEVEDTAWFVTALQSGGGKLTALLSDTRTVALEAEALKYENESLYLGLPGDERARFLSAAYYDLLRDLQEDDQFYYVTIAGKRANLAAKGAASPARPPASPKRD